MSSPYSEDILEDIPIEDFHGATLQIDPASAPVSRSVSPNPPLASAGSSNQDSNFQSGDEKLRKRPLFRTAKSDPMVETYASPSPESIKNFYSEQGMSRSFYQQPPIGEPRRASWHDDSRLDEGIREFFSVRVGALDQALEECRFLLDPELDGDVKGAWLLTEINHWDIEKERVVLLCELSVLIVKYDFIALHHVYYNRIQFANFEKMEAGEITYPSHSLVPRISGIAGGVVTVIRGVIFNRLTTTISKLNSWRGATEVKPEARVEDTSGGDAIQEENTNCSLSTISFEPRWRNMQGIRITWNASHQLSFSQKWNPFCKDIPYTTFTSHPLYWYSGCEISTYDVKNFVQELKKALKEFHDRPDSATVGCSVVTNDIVIENYVGIASLIHNFGELGFFKLRGKVSF